MRRALLPLLPLLPLLLLLVLAAPAAAATERRTYSPYGPDGGPRPGLRVVPQAGECFVQSPRVAGALRCATGDRLRDPCYLDRAAQPLPRVLCVASPWSSTAVTFEPPDLPEPVDGLEPQRPWALELASGRRCVAVGGATTVVDGRRLNYVCRGRTTRFLFGSPDRSRATWHIRQARSARGTGMRRVAIAVAWR
jgi:hypothetical protein